MYEKESAISEDPYGGLQVMGKSFFKNLFPISPFKWEVSFNSLESLRQIDVQRLQFCQINPVVRESVR